MTVDYKTLSGTATGSRDATVGNPADYCDQDSSVELTPLVFAPGETTKTISISIIDDETVENAEDFTAIIFHPLSGDHVRYGIPEVTDATATITILDNDVGSTVRFNPASYTGAEQTGSSTVTLTITAARLGDPNTPLSVDYATSDGTGRMNLDYAPKHGTVTFGPGETQKTITLTILDDILIENPEEFFVTLSNPSNASLDPSGGSIATVAIADNDSGISTIQFETSSYSTSESANRASLTVTRSGGLGYAVGVSYATADGSAISGADYVATSSTVAFAPGEFRKTISVPITDDSTRELNETFSVNLSMPTVNSMLGSTASAVITILDDDSALPVDFSTKLLNISTRGPVEQGDDVMIAGFILRGTARKDVVLRGLGPSLSQLGVIGPIDDPTLALFDSNGTQLAFNDDFADNSETDQAALEATELTPSDAREAAIVTSLTPANYTVILRGKTNGVGLVEVYDTNRTAASHFANISTRGKVEQGDNGAMIAGFIIGAPSGHPGTAQRVVIRANGPSLTNAGISNSLADTALDLYRGPQLILSNDNWQTNSAADRQELTSDGLAPPNDKEAALVTNLDPGSYTAVVRGKDNTTGVALVEVYLVGP